MIALCDELKQDGPADLTNRALSFLIVAVAGGSPTNAFLNTPLDKSIESLRGVSMRWPSCLAFSFALATSLTLRFVQTFSDDDYNEAVAIVNRIIISPSHEDDSEFWSNWSPALLTAAASLRSRDVAVRFRTLGEPDPGLVQDLALGLNRTKSRFGVCLNLVNLSGPGPNL